MFESKNQFKFVKTRLCYFVITSDSLRKQDKEMPLSSQTEPSTESGGKRPRGRPRKIPLPEMPTEDGGKRMLSKRLGVMDRESLINEGFQRGIEYAQQQGGAFSGGKFSRIYKVA